jgi:hypothetical protein
MLIRFLLAVALVLALVWAGVRIARKSEAAGLRQPTIATTSGFTAAA